MTPEKLPLNYCYRHQCHFLAEYGCMDCFEEAEGDKSEEEAE